MTKKFPKTSSLKRPPSPNNKNNTSVTNQNNHVSDAQLAKDLFETPKPQVVVQPPNNIPPKPTIIEPLQQATSSSQPIASSSKTTQLRPNLIDPDEYVHHEDIDDDAMDFENEKDFIVVAKPTAFALAARIPDDPKKPPKEIIKMVNEAFINKESFKGANYRHVNLVRSIIVYFNDKQDMDDTHNVIIQKEEYKLPPLEEYETYKTNMQFNARTIHVSDLRLDLKIDVVQSIFSKYGKITNCVLQTKDMWQHAYITYDSPKAIEIFYSSWSRLIFNDCVRVHPCNLTAEQIKSRNENRVKLTNLPFNTTSRDIQDILRATNAKSSYIPRSTQYKPKPFVIIFYENATALNDATKQNFAYGGNNLEWVSADTKLCHKCGSSQHIAIKCPKLSKPKVNNTSSQPNDSTQKKPTVTQAERLQKLYHKYKPAGVKRTNKLSTEKNSKSYAEMAKNNKGKGKEQPQNQKSSENIDHSVHNPNNNISSNNNTNLEKKLDLIINKLDDMQKSINDLNDRINKLEEWKKTFDTPPVTSSPLSQASTSPKIINVTSSNSTPTNSNKSSASKRIRITTNSSSESDTPQTPSPVTAPKPDRDQIIHQQADIIKEQQSQLNQCMAEIRRLSERLI